MLRVSNTSHNSHTPLDHNDDADGGQETRASNSRIRQGRRAGRVAPSVVSRNPARDTTRTMRRPGEEGGRKMRIGPQRALGQRIGGRCSSNASTSCDSSSPCGDNSWLGMGNAGCNSHLRQATATRGGSGGGGGSLHGTPPMRIPCAIDDDDGS